jgi:hypothetical protein
LTRAATIAIPPPINEAEADRELTPQPVHVGVQQSDVVLCGALLAKRSGVFFGQNLGLLHRHTGRRQRLTKAWVSKMAVAIFQMWPGPYC